MSRRVAILFSVALLVVIIVIIGGIKAETNWFYD